MYIPKITTYDTKIIPSMYSAGWRLIAIYDNKIFWDKEEKAPRKLRGPVNSDSFSEFYSKYPNKKARKDAEVMWNRLSEKEQELAIEGIKRYVVYWKKKNMDKQYMPHPATWLNARRWEDNLSETVDIQPTQNEERIKKELEEQRKNEKEKKELDERIAKCRANPEEWKKINELAYSQLTEQQRNSPVKDALIQVKIRTILSNYK